MSHRSWTSFRTLVRLGAVAALTMSLAACSGDDDGDETGNGGSDSEPATVIGTLTFGGESYELTQSECQVAAEGLASWFAFDADGNVEFAVYGGDNSSVALLVRDDNPQGPSWEQTEDASQIDVEGDEAGVAGSATVVPAVPEGIEPTSAAETVEFEFTC